MATAAALSYQTVPDAGRPIGVHPATITRWILRGVLDPRTGTRIKLEAVRTPGKWLVPEGAVDRFLAAVTAARTGKPAKVDISAARERELAAVDSELQAIGLG